MTQHPVVNTPGVRMILRPRDPGAKHRFTVPMWLIAALLLALSIFISIPTFR